MHRYSRENEINTQHNSKIEDTNMQKYSLELNAT